VQSGRGLRLRTPLKRLSDHGKVVTGLPVCPQPAYVFRLAFPPELPTPGDSAGRSSQEPTEEPQRDPVVRNHPGLGSSPDPVDVEGRLTEKIYALPSVRKGSESRTGATRGVCCTHFAPTISECS
jgi:hypothetical protein